MILLTGATGYIASHTWLALDAAGFEVVGLDNFANSSPEVLRRLAALGADTSRFVEPTLTTRSTSPQSMPRSSVEVQTTALSRPAAIASSTRRRCATSSEP